MQYEIGLPADYDMRIIQQRVATRGSATDDFSGLALKAYAVRRIGRHGSPVNAYSPFYFWRDPSAMNRFLYGPFRGIVNDFGRPEVRHWVGASFHRFSDNRREPILATRSVERIPDEAPGEAVAALIAQLEVRSGAHSAAVGIDPSRWEAVRFTLWTHLPEELHGETVYDVLHVSAPELDEAATGRLW